MPSSPLQHLWWIRWIDRSEVPSALVALLVFLAFVPFYDFSTLTPRLPLGASVFPAAFALVLMFLLHLTRGAAEDMRQLLGANRISVPDVVALSPGKRAARLELFAGLAIGAALIGARSEDLILSDQQPPSLLTIIAVCCAFVGFAVVQVHLLVFCVRQARVYRRIARTFSVDLLAPELHTTLSNPLIRFIIVGLAALSFGLLIFEVAPYPSLQGRVIQTGLITGVVWSVFIVVSLIPLFILRTRIGVAKTLEINLVRQALKGDPSSLRVSQFGPRLAEFSLGDLMVYEQRIRNVWEWPVRAHVRRLVIFGLLPPLTWVLAAAVEVVFESMLAAT